MTSALAAQASQTEFPIDRVELIRARADAATAGVPEWIFEGSGHSFEVFTGPLSTDSEDVASYIFREADAEFIAAARQDIPFLLGLVDGLKTRLGEASPAAPAQ